VRPVKRVLVFLSEIPIFLGVFFLSELIAMGIGLVDSRLAQPVAWLGFLLSVLGFFLARRYTRPWKIEYDAAGYLLNQAERRLHPTRTRYRRTVNRILLWAPSAIATFVLLFYPIASHLWHPTSRYFPRFRIPIPWTYTVWRFSQSPVNLVFVYVDHGGKARFGIMPFWGNWDFSYMVFATGGSDGIPYAQKEAATQGPTSEFQLRNVHITCFQFLPKRTWLPFGPGPVYEVTCDSLPASQRAGFHAAFFGRERDLPEFYKIVAGVTATK